MTINAKHHCAAQHAVFLDSFLKLRIQNLNSGIYDTAGPEDFSPNNKMHFPSTRSRPRSSISQVRH